MALNGISTLPTKQARQIAKLDLASARREALGNPRFVYDIMMLPSRYVGNASIDNPNPSGLVVGRPWSIETIPEVEGQLLTESGQCLLTESGIMIIGIDT
jgi:hypothetical protein